MTPTPAGEAFVHHARLVLERVQHLAGDMQEYGEGIKGHVRIWANTTAISEFLPAALSTFLRDYPDVNIDLREVLSGEIVKGVADGATDIGIVAGNVHAGQLEMPALPDDRLVLVTALRHPAWRPRQGGAISRRRWTTTTSACRTPERDPHVHRRRARATHWARRIKLRIQVGNFEAACRMIEAGVGDRRGAAIHRAAPRAPLTIAIVPLNDAVGRAQAENLRTQSGRTAAVRAHAGGKADGGRRHCFHSAS